MYADVFTCIYGYTHVYVGMDTCVFGYAHMHMCVCTYMRKSEDILIPSSLLYSLETEYLS